MSAKKPVKGKRKLSDAMRIIRIASGDSKAETCGEGRARRRDKA